MNWKLLGSTALEVFKFVGSILGIVLFICSVGLAINALIDVAGAFVAVIVYMGICLTVIILALYWIQGGRFRKGS